ncbi:SMI1/KNR4 family protein [Candidatus Protochlamydia phocaeensis]|uniref:SMI1/KNR4 family protein n=1 Tax=Candidatus Protochlamydia phocaeensis TaxID=1414722 RepID=UPI000837DA3B|nr:SMI1/KNR4 family protein [Candidatus Protochlamydia phocaeensis]
MDQHALEYYSSYSEEAPHAHFHKVIMLQEDPMIDWEEALALAPKLCRGWYELAQLPLQDRIEFTREFWLAKLPYHPNLNEFLNKFFSSLDDIGIFLFQPKYEDPFEVSLVYSLADNSGFFHGNAPATEQEIIALQKVFPDYILPPDYLAFLQIHNGFAKLTDTGITKSAEMEESYMNFQKVLEKDYPITTSKGGTVNPKSLIPFYCSFGMSFFQCFWGEWYPGQEMGNVYYSGETKTISDCMQTADCVETMAFENFTDWLMFYLEKID